MISTRRGFLASLRIPFAAESLNLERSDALNWKKKKALITNEYTTGSAKNHTHAHTRTIVVPTNNNS